MSFNINTPKKPNIPDDILAPVLLCIHLLFLISCASHSLEVNKKLEPFVATQFTSSFKEAPRSEPSFVPALEKDEIGVLSGTAMMTHVYEKIVERISIGEYDVALKGLEQFTDRYTTPQIYVVEAHLLRLIIISGYRAAYLQLAEAYHLGWEEIVQVPDGELPVEERIGRLTNLSKTSLEYFQKHKEMAVRLINAYEAFKAFYPTIKSERLQLIADPLKAVKDTKNTSLDRVKKGNWLKTVERLKAERIEINNCMLDFWAGLMGVRDIRRANKLLGRGSYPLNKHDFFVWLGKSLSYQIDTVRPEAFKDEPELISILKNKSLECQELAK